MMLSSVAKNAISKEAVYDGISNKPMRFRKALRCPFLGPRGERT